MISIESDPFDTGAVVGGAIALHGLDQYQTGIQQAWTGSQVDSLTSQTLQSAGMSQNSANLTDAAVGIAAGVFSFGKGFSSFVSQSAYIFWLKEFPNT